ncbi:MAG: molybdopterin-binding/glycosyltransferase family 2 protein [Rhodospirillales bacterium]|nr:molybdopterin-binding/glycosyltransferase family 2 protein [Rhodospirillales bacterium]MDH3792041.1 molybdopterin-binding/glycosyltransferase family 2 protein [Rhodospirillales bacterium]MDH3911636.1 molybdopterin-binding/glycosyltransferase family 2 protein [Rhodospirillales bacterium]MDH3969981.1 molybdopterin-binding/glycosyltransferase family 2 protein [Rhodospirillales bacterium]
MIFGPTPLDQAEGAILAHSLKLRQVVFKKGRILSAEDVAALAEAGHTGVIAARVEPGDLHEDAAATAVAEVLMGGGLAATAAFTGRCNLIARQRGLLVVDDERLDRLNQVDEAITVATLRPYDAIEPRQMAATVKIIPFAVPEAAVARCREIAGEAEPLVQIAPFATRRVGLIQTSLPGTKPRLLDKTRRAVDARLAALDCQPAEEVRCAHDEAEVAAAIEALMARGCEIVLVSGASAIVDRRDVVPAGMVRAGAAIEHFGMPVDPGNLILLARRGDTALVGLPGCARSPKLNGFDWVLQRLVAGLPVARRDVMRMGAGGLLKEIAGRPLPRAQAVEGTGPEAPRAPHIAALVLAAGRSTRMGPVNKLLADVEGRPMVARVADAARTSQAAPVIVVTGHERERVEATLTGLDVTLVHNPDYAAGLSTSLHRGLAALPEATEGMVVCLGDMPRVTATVIDRLIAAFDPLEGRAICLPTWRGKRGNPVLFARRYFAEMQTISGDVGAKALIGEYPEEVCEVAMADDAVLSDVDTPAGLAALKSAG